MIPSLITINNKRCFIASHNCNTMTSYLQHYDSTDGTGSDGMYMTDEELNKLIEDSCDGAL